jgi:hypothetical protein
MRPTPTRTSCVQSQTLLFIMISTTFQDEIYLGFPGDQTLPKFETSFLGGQPCFLSVPEQRLLEC